jgi:hypothetical protein
MHVVSDSVNTGANIAVDRIVDRVLASRLHRVPIQCTKRFICVVQLSECACYLLHLHPVSLAAKALSSTTHI